ncbi:phage baseplate protein [Streptomyces spiralis]
MNPEMRTPSRRQLLKWGGGLVGVGAFGSVMLTSSSASAAAVTSSKHFDLTAASTMFLREIDLQETRVLQSFAFDNTNKHLYTAQLVQGGRELPGETQFYDGAARAAQGDLCITRLDWGGNEIGRMYLKGFGHGVSIAVEPSGNSAYLWTECDVDMTKNPDGSGNRYGTKIARFKFANGAVLTTASAALTKYTPVAGSTNTTVAIDPANSRIAHRYNLNGTWKYALYDLATFKSGGSPLTTITQVSDLTGVTFQGYTTYGQYLYTIDGTAYGTSGSVEGTGNTYITCVDWNTGTKVDRQLTKAGSSLSYREPEGLAVQIPDTSNMAAVRLHMGFASGADASAPKQASFYYKDVLV